MTQLSAQPPTPAMAAVQATVTPYADADAKGEAGFAAVLQAHIDLPAAPQTEILAALLPAGKTPDTPAPEQEGSAPDLSALLPTVAGLMLQAAASPAASAPTQAGSAEIPLSPGAPTALLPGAATLFPVSIQPGGETPATENGTSAQATSAAMPGMRAPVEARAMPATTDRQMAAVTAETVETAVAPAPVALNQHASDGARPAPIRIDTPVGSRGWEAEVGQKVVLMVNRLESRAELTLTPPQMGRVDVSISVDGDRSSATFVAASPAAREALEQALPRLREILADAGISLGRASVNPESPRRHDEGAQSRAQDGRRHAEAAAVAPTATPWLHRGAGLIDTFA